MRSLNVRLLLILIATTLCVGGIVHVVHGVQTGRHADVFLREAKRAEERGARFEAIDFLQRYLEVNPNAAEETARLGRLLADTGRYGPAYFTLGKALRLDAKNDEVRRRLIEVAIGIGRNNDALAHLKRIEPLDGELLDLRAQAQYALSNYSAAAESLKKAKEKSPSRLETYVRLATLQREHFKNPAAARAVLIEMVELNSEVGRAYVLRGSDRLDHPKDAANQERAVEANSGEADQADAAYEVAGDQDTTAIQDARSALALAPDDPEVLTFAARALLAEGDLAEARTHALRASEIAPASPLVYSLLADIELKDKRTEAAIDWLKKGIEATSNDENLLWNLANLLIAQGRSADGEEVIGKLDASDYPKAPVAYLKGRVSAEQQRWREAVRRLEGIRSALRDWPELQREADYWLGRCYGELGSTDQQLVAFRRAAKADPLWIPARLGLADALLATGQFEESLAEYEQIARLPGAPALVLTQMARLLIFKNLRQNEAERNWDVVESLLARVERLGPGSPHVPILRAEALVAQGQEAEAEKLLTSARDQMPDKPEIWTALAALAQRQKDWDVALGVLDGAHEQLGDSVLLRLARARLLVARSGEEAREGLRQLGDAAESFAAAERVELYEGLGRLALAIGDFAHVGILSEQVAQTEPNNLRVWLLLFDLAFRSGDANAMDATLKELRRIEGTGPLWRYGEAVRLALEGKQNDDSRFFAQAEEHLAKARLARPNWSRVPLLLGQVSDMQAARFESEDTNKARTFEDAAVDHYLAAINLGESNPAIVERTIELLHKRKRFVEAKDLVDKLHARQSGFSDQMARLAADVSLRVEDYDRAISLAEQAAGTSDRASDHLWLAQALELAGRRGEAEEHIQKAIGMEPAALEAWVALVQYFGRGGDLTKAQETIAKAAEAIRGEDRSLALAQCHELIGQVAEAEKACRAALEEFPNDALIVRRVTEFYLRHGKATEAEPLLRRLFDGSLGTEREDQHWARRNLAVILAVRGGGPNLSAAQKLVEDNGREGSEAPADRRAKAMVLASSRDPRVQAEALAIFEALGKSTPAGETRNPEELFVLARLYLAQNNWSKATAEMRGLLASHASEPRYLATYVSALLNRGELSEAELWLRRLEQVAPGDYGTVQLRCEALFRGERYPEIESRLDAFLAAAAEEDADRQLRIRRAALLFEAYAKRLAAQEEQAVAASRLARRAAELQTRYVAERPEERLALAAFHARQREFDAALTLLEENSENATPEEIARIALTLIAAGNATTEHFDRARRVLEQALERLDRPVTLVMALADLQSWSERYDQAEALYREVIARDDRNAIAMNNLALVCGFRSSDRREALELIKRALSLAGFSPALLDSRATIYLAAGDFKRAMDDCVVVNQAQPSGASLFHHAYVSHRLGRNDVARELLAKAHELDLDANELHPLERALYVNLTNALR